MQHQQTPTPTPPAAPDPPGTREQLAEDIATILRKNPDLLARVCASLRIAPINAARKQPPPPPPLFPAYIPTTSLALVEAHAQTLHHHEKARAACITGLERALTRLLDETRLPDAARAKALHYYAYGIRTLGLAHGLTPRGPGRPVTTGATANRLHRSLFGAGHGGRRPGSGRKPKTKVAPAEAKTPINYMNGPLPKPAPTAAP